MLDHPGVRGGAALREADLGPGAERAHPGPVGVACLLVPATRGGECVEGVLPPARAPRELLCLLLATEAAGPVGEAVVGGGRLQRLRGAAPAVARALGGVAQPQVLCEVGPHPGALPGAAVGRQAVRVGDSRLPRQGVERRLDLEAVHAESVHARQRRGARVAGHHAGGAVDVHPAVPHAAVLPRQVEQGLGEVAGDLRLQQGEQLGVRAVLVPAREVAVLGPLAAAHPVDPLVPARVGAGDVARHVRLQERVVHRGVEGRELLGRAALHAHPPQVLVPVALAPVRDARHGLPGPQLLAQVLLGRLGAGVRQPDPHRDRLRGGGVEGDVAPRAPAGALRPRLVALAT